MWIFYICSIIPLIIGGVLWLKSEGQISWKEWVGGTVIALFLAVIFQLISVFGMTSDTETWSGQISHAIFYPQWVEEYEESHTICTGSGKNEHCTTYYTTEYRTHYEHWSAVTTLGDENGITHDFFWNIHWNFMEKEKPVVERPGKSGFYSGDPNIYVAYNRTGFIYPVTDSRNWSNKIKACPSVFSYPKVDIQKEGVFPYPKNENWLVSDRLVGATAIDKLEWDRMNSRLGPTKKVNVILVHLSGDQHQALLQEAAWIGGKKNDLVICFGGPPKKPNWTYVFGWTEEDIVKRNLETIVLNNEVNNALIPLIESEIQTHYVIKDWKKFDYLKVEPPTWAYMVYFITMILTQSVFWYFAETNTEY